MTTLNLHLARLAAWWYSRLEPLSDERGGGRNSDESFHIATGLVIGGSIAAAVTAYVAKQLGFLQ